MALGGNKRSEAGKKASGTFRRLENLRKDATKTVSFRLDPRDVEKLERIAVDRGLKLGQLVKSWVVEKMREEH